jgi:hypothetical protein
MPNVGHNEAIREGGDMDVIIDKGCGLDVHKETVVACVMGEGIKKEIRTFSTMTEDLFRLQEWLSEKGVTGKPNRHLDNNIKASWLLKDLADGTSSRFTHLSQNPPLNERLTAIQSALFMIGYDVRQI